MEIAFTKNLNLTTLHNPTNTSLINPNTDITFLNYTKNSNGGGQNDLSRILMTEYNFINLNRIYATASAHANNLTVINEPKQDQVQKQGEVVKTQQPQANQFLSSLGIEGGTATK